MHIRIRSGQSLMELLIGIAVGALFVVGAATIIVPSLKVGTQAGNVQEQAQLGEDLLNNVRAWSQGNWGSVLALGTTTANKYYLNTATSPFVPVQVGVAYAGYFDGTDNYVSTANATTGPATYSLSLWFKTTTASGGKLIGFGNLQTGSSASFDRHIYMMNDGQLIFGNYNGSPQIVTSPSSYNDGAWHNVIGTLSSAGTYLYVDGTLVASSSNAAAANYSGYWKIGYDNLNTWPNIPSSYYFAGSIDNVLVYNTGISSAAAQAIYAGSPPSSGLVDDWSLNGNASDTASAADNGIWNGTPSNGGSYYVSVSVPGNGQSISTCAGGATTTLCATYYRYFYLTDIYRDGLGNATTTSSTNYYDPSTKLVTVVVSEASSTAAPLTYTEYITRIGNNALSQTTWAGGSGQTSPVTFVSSTYSTATSVTVNATGSLSLSGGPAPGGSCYATVSTPNFSEWALDEGSGTVANDSGGNGDTGTWYGSTNASGTHYATGKIGPYAGYFNGSDDYISTPMQNIFNNISVTAWVYSSNFSQNGMVVEKDPVNTQWELYFESGYLKWRGGSTAAVMYASPSNNAWHFVAATQTGTTATLYIDGTAVASGTVAAIGDGISGTGNLINIGRYGSGYYFNGLIDDARVYPWLLSASDVNNIYLGN